jgi:hypothetical protein
MDLMGLKDVVESKATMTEDEFEVRSRLPAFGLTLMGLW